MLVLLASASEVWMELPSTQLLNQFHPDHVSRRQQN